MTISTNTRAALLPALQAALTRHLNDAEHDARNLAVVRVLREAGATWSDVLGPARDGDAYLVELMRFGNAAKAGLTPAECGRGLLRLVACMPPGMVASAAVLAAAAPHQHAQAVEELQALALTVLEFGMETAP